MVIKFDARKKKDYKNFFVKESVHFAWLDQPPMGLIPHHRADSLFQLYFLLNPTEPHFAEKKIVIKILMSRKSNLKLLMTNRNRDAWYIM